MVNIYILRLEHAKYYIGKTDKPNFRIEDHFNSKGSTWTKMHRPIELVGLIPDCDDYDEDKWTLKYMEKYGISNVRGGSFSQVNLSEENISTIERMLKGSNNKCFKCGKAGHFINNCSIDFKVESDIEKVINSGNKEELKKILENEDRCFRCFRKGHFQKTCYAKKDLLGRLINKTQSEGSLCSFCKRGFTTRKGAKYHENFYCPNNPSRGTKRSVTSDESCVII